jgi:hypothetical protein
MDNKEVLLAHEQQSLDQSIQLESPSSVKATDEEPFTEARSHIDQCLLEMKFSISRPLPGNASSASLYSSRHRPQVSDGPKARKNGKTLIVLPYALPRHKHSPPILLRDLLLPKSDSVLLVTTPQHRRMGTSSSCRKLLLLSRILRPRISLLTSRLGSSLRRAYILVTKSHSLRRGRTSTSACLR